MNHLNDPRWCVWDAWHDDDESGNANMSLSIKNGDNPSHILAFLMDGVADVSLMRGAYLWGWEEAVDLLPGLMERERADAMV